MNYQTFQPHPDLSALVKFYWTLEVPFDPNNHRQKIIPDGCIEMTFNFKSGIKRYTTDEEYVVHPNAMVMGQRTKSIFIEPLGDVDSFAICFYPHGFASFAGTSLDRLVDLEAPIELFFGEAPARELELALHEANNTQKRIEIVERFLLERLRLTTTVENLVQTTVDVLMSSSGTSPIHALMEDDRAQRRKLERAFRKQIGLSPKQLGRVIRLQTALKMLLNEKESLTSIAYESEYFDQAHFNKDFKELVGATPKEFLRSESSALSSLFYK